MNNDSHALEATSENFDQRVLERSKSVLVVVDFWADWCAPCKMLMPILEKLTQEYAGSFELVKVNTDQQQELAAHHGIRSLPTLRFFKGGETVEELHGVQPEEVLRQAIERHVVRESDSLREQAVQAAEIGQTEQALALLDQAAAMDPDNHKVALERARLLSQQGELETARDLIQGLPPDVREEPDAKALSAILEFSEAVRDAPPVATLEQMLADNPSDSQARYQLGARKVLSRDYEQALEQFTELMQKDPAFGDQAGRRAMLSVFDLLGGEGELVARYRKRMFALLH